MKKLLVLLMLISNTIFSQPNGLKAPDNNVSAEQAKRMVKNANNDKFIEKYNYHNGNETIVCESLRGRPEKCFADTRYGVNIIQQLSNASCNNNWGYTDQGIWVDNGCRAEFSINSGWDQGGSVDNIMVCESYRYKRNYCAAYLNGRDVFLLNQLSNSSCIGNWGYDRNGVWVTNGCRAEFVVEDRHYNQNGLLTCSSRNFQFQGCQADTRGGVEFARQLSRASCNGNWGYDRQGIWVTNGCRAQFKVLPYVPVYSGPSTVKCSSRSNRRKACRADTSGGVRLKKQHSRANCRGNWGYTRNQIWVDNGCRATFQLHINGNQNYGYGNNQNYGNNQGFGNNRGIDYGRNSNHQQQYDNVTCSSRNLRRQTCEIPQGSKVRIVRQLSRSTCDNQWGYNRDVLWVNNGCRAEFSIHK